MLILYTVIKAEIFAKFFLLISAYGIWLHSILCQKGKILHQKKLEKDVEVQIIFRRLKELDDN